MRDFFVFTSAIWGSQQKKGRKSSLLSARLFFHLVYEKKKKKVAHLHKHIFVLISVLTPYGPVGRKRKCSLLMGSLLFCLADKETNNRMMVQLSEIWLKPPGKFPEKSASARTTFSLPLSRNNIQLLSFPSLPYWFTVRGEKRVPEELTLFRGLPYSIIEMKGFVSFGVAMTI